MPAARPPAPSGWPVSPGDASFGSTTGLLPGAPGASKDFLVRNTGTVPASTVTIQLADRQDSENGCVSDSEKALDPECDQTCDRGDLANQAVVTATQYAPLSGACGDAAFTAATKVPFMTLVAPAATGTGYQPARTSLAALDDTNTLGTLPFTGTATCVRVTLALPSLPDNDAVQGDTVFFKVRLGLVQATSTPPPSN